MLCIAPFGDIDLCSVTLHIRSTLHKPHVNFPDWGTLAVENS